MDNRIEEFIKRINAIDSTKEYDAEMKRLNCILLEEKYPEQLCMEIRNKHKYI